MSDVSRILNQIASGDPSTTNELLPLVYDELRKLAAEKLKHEKAGQTLSATALVHEAYVRLVGSHEPQSWNGKGHFFVAAAEAMRRVLINRARDKHRLKRGGNRQRLDFSLMSHALETPDETLLEFNEAISMLENVDPISAQLVKLRFFGGLRHADAATTLGLSRRQADRLWAFARAWLYDHLQPVGSKNSNGHLER